MSKYAVVDEKGHILLLGAERDMYDHTRLQRVLKPYLSRCDNMMICVACPTVPFIYLAMNHMVFDLESHRVFKDHFLMFYEDLTRKVGVLHCLVFMSRTAPCICALSNTVIFKGLSLSDLAQFVGHTYASHLDGAGSQR